MTIKEKVLKKIVENQKFDEEPSVHMNYYVKRAIDLTLKEVFSEIERLNVSENKDDCIVIEGDSWVNLKGDNK